MKKFVYIDPYEKSNIVRDQAYKTDDGIIKVVGNFDGKILEYITIYNHNGDKVHVRTELIPELIEILKQY